MNPDSNLNTPIPRCLLQIFGCALKQSLVYHDDRPKTYSTALAVGTIFICNFLVAIMYENVVISMMIAMGETRDIGSLSDLLKPQYKEIRYVLGYRVQVQHDWRTF